MTSSIEVSECHYDNFSYRNSLVAMLNFVA